MNWVLGVDDRGWPMGATNPRGSIVALVGEVMRKKLERAKTRIHGGCWSAKR